MIELLKFKLLNQGLHPQLVTVLAYLGVILGVLLLAIIFDWIAKRVILRTLQKLISRSRIGWDDIALKKGIFDRLGHLAPALVFYLAAPLFIIPQYVWSYSLATLIRRMALVAMIVVIIYVIDAVLNMVLQLYRNLEIAKSKPIRSYIQVAKIFLFFIGGILIFSIILQRSPWAFLTGLGAMAAVIMLIFKDSILGFVASVQINAYDTIRIGDWIEMPKYSADGEVLEMSLNTIKIRNWDNTIVSVPTYAILSESVKNWRGMSEAGGRRIKRHFNIDINTIRFCDDEMLGRYSKLQYVSEYLEAKRLEVKEYNQQHNIDDKQLGNGRQLTNVGTFRAYVEAFLKHNQKLHKGMTFLVRQLQSTSEGLPIEIYVFTSDTRWVQYEAIQADIFDHILAVVPCFDLAIFQNTSGQNYKIDIVSMPQVGNG